MNGRTERKHSTTTHRNTRACRLHAAIARGSREVVLDAEEGGVVADGAGECSLGEGDVLHPDVVRRVCRWQLVAGASDDHHQSPFAVVLRDAEATQTVARVVEVPRPGGKRGRERGRNGRGGVRRKGTEEREEREDRRAKSTSDSAPRTWMAYLGDLRQCLGRSAECTPAVGPD